MLLSKSEFMNYLPLLILGYFVLSNKNTNYKEILSTLTEEDIATLLCYIGIDEVNASAISHTVPNLIKGDLDLQKLLPIALPLITNLFNKKPQDLTVNDYKITEGLDEVEGIVNEEIANQLKSYFS